MSLSLVRRAALAVVILGAQFVALEAGLRVWSGSEASPGFQSLFMDDAVVGHRLKPGAHLQYTTSEFTTDLAINAQGVRDDEPIGPKAPNERRVVVLGDSLVLSVQVDLAVTFCKQLEGRLNARDPAHRWRVINAGVQGYGPVEEWLLYRHLAEDFDPDVVLVVVFVANDALDAYNAQAALDAGHAIVSNRAVETTTAARRLVRSSMVLQLVHLRLDQLRARLSTPTVEAALTIYLANPPPLVAQGLAVARRAIGMIADRARSRGARTGIVLMPARFQTDDDDYGRLAVTVRESGGTLVRDAATTRFQRALAPLGLPMLDLLPVLASQPDRGGLFFQSNVHLTPRGHGVVADALLHFMADDGLIGG